MVLLKIGKELSIFIDNYIFIFVS